MTFGAALHRYLERNATPERLALLVANGLIHTEATRAAHADLLACVAANNARGNPTEEERIINTEWHALLAERERNSIPEYTRFAAMYTAAACRRLAAIAESRTREEADAILLQQLLDEDADRLRCTAPAPCHRATLVCVHD
jgi:hypothetical protein